ncbi:hypothetical protein TH19_20855 [Thalassospira profundimaris]|uniref:Uncharacterized protein n=1 Tax=Thalassospira profundimaris TaxID=502049 RepID=A0A367VZ96_9PROT|nr:hypothetical protein TH19_20855 [Thalassospira profundimaris]
MKLIVFVLGLLIGISIGSVIGLQVIHRPLGDGWSSIAGAILGAGITSATALLLIYHQHHLMLKASKTEKFSDILGSFEKIEEIFDWFNHSLRTDYFTRVRDTDGVAITLDHELVVAARKCIRQINYLDDELTNLRPELDTVELSGRIPLGVRQKFKRVLESLTRVEDAADTVDFAIIRDMSDAELIERAHEVTVMIVPTEIREARRYMKWAKQEIGL